jgi:hypothetical protein
MAKMHHPSGAHPAGLQETENSAAEALTTGHFRKARDLYKELCKVDRPRFVGRLIEANQGLALQMIQKGQCSEAVQVRNYLKTIAAPEVLLELDLELARRQHHWPETLRAALALWNLPSGAQRGALLADIIVLASPSPHEVASFPEPLASEAALILGGLEDLSAGRFDALAEKLRPLGTGSLFAVWKTFLKGLSAFHSGALEKAQTFFKKLPEDSVAARASKAYAFFIAGEKALEGAPPQAQAQMLHGSLSLLGQSAYAPALARAQECWRAGRHRDSYKELRTVATFPSLEVGLAGALSDFYFKGCTALDESAVDSFLSYSEHLLFEGLPKSDQEACCIARLLLRTCVTGRSVIHPELVMKRLEQCYKGTSPDLKELLSLGYYRAAQFLTKQNERDEEHDPLNPEVIYIQIVIVDLLEKSIAANPLHMDAHLALVSAHRHMPKELQLVASVIETLCGRFPQEKAVFLLAGQIHTEADPPDYEAAATYLQTALSLDYFNAEILEKLAHARIYAAAKAYTSGDPATGRQHFELLEPHLLDQCEHFERSREFALIRRAVLETLFGDGKKGKALLDSTLAATRSKPALLLLFHACSQLWAKKLGPQKPILKCLVQEPPRSTGERSSLLSILFHVRQWSPVSHRTAWTEEHRAVVKCLMPLADEAFSESECASLLPQLAENALLLPLAKAIAKTGVKRAPDRFLFKAAHYILTTRQSHSEQKKTLELFRHLAGATGDKEALKCISSRLQSLARFSIFEPAEEEEEPTARRPAKKTKPAAAKKTKPAPAQRKKNSEVKTTRKAAAPEEPSIQMDLL